MNQTNFLDAEIPAWQGGKARPEPVPPDRERTDAQRGKILARLQRGPAQNIELTDICLRYSARIFELRKAGYRIEKRHLGGSLFVYELK